MALKHLLEIDSVTFQVTGKTLLKDVYVSLETGKITGLMGRNGSGKSTLMKILFGTQLAESCCIRVNKEYIKRPLSQPGLIAFCPQFSFLPSYLSISETYTLFELNQANAKRVTSYLQEAEKTKCGALSGGKLRMLEIMCCLFSARTFVLLDEPFSNLSPVWVEQLQGILLEMKKSKGILITDHMYEMVANISDHLYLCENGAVREIRGLEDLKNSPYLT